MNFDFLYLSLSRLQSVHFFLLSPDLVQSSLQIIVLKAFMAPRSFAASTQRNK